MLVNSQTLGTIGFFKDLEPSLLEQLAAHSRLKTYDINEVVFHEGNALSPCLYWLASGSLRMTKLSESGKETILRLLWADAVFAAPALFGDGHPSLRLNLNRLALNFMTLQLEFDAWQTKW